MRHIVGHWERERYGKSNPNSAEFMGDYQIPRKTKQYLIWEKPIKLLIIATLIRQLEFRVSGA